MKSNSNVLNDLCCLLPCSRKSAIYGCKGQKAVRGVKSGVHYIAFFSFFSLSPQVPFSNGQSITLINKALQNGSQYKIRFFCYSLWLVFGQCPSIQKSLWLPLQNSLFLLLTLASVWSMALITKFCHSATCVVRVMVMALTTEFAFFVTCVG